MENEDSEAAPSIRKKPFVLFRIWQWLVAALFAILLAFMLGQIPQLSSPGAPVALYWVSMAAFAATIIVFAPPLFFRLGGRSRLFSYGALVGTALTGLYASGGVVEAYERTPKGAREAKIAKAERAKLDAEEAERLKTQEDSAQFERQQQQAAQFETKLKACLSWSGRVPAFEEAVQNSLHNPKAFEHVATQLIKDDDEGRNIAMEFRAENAFGAIRTAFVKAQLSPDTCEVSNLSEPES